MRVRNLVVTLAGSALLLTLAACGASIESGLALKATPLKGDPQIKFSTTKAIVVVDITSPTGIGSAEIEKTSGHWPPKIVMHFHLKGLEDLQFAYGDKTVKASVSSSGSNAVQESIVSGGKETPITPDDPYWMNVNILAKDGSPGQIPLEDGTIVVAAPQDFLQSGETKFTISWVDFYR